MICPKCGNNNNESNKFCIECGSKLPDGNEINQPVPVEVEHEVGTLDTQIVNKKISEYSGEAKLADKVYKSYVTDGISRLDKVNGRFLATQTIKLDVLIDQNKQLIEQNNEIIKLLKEISTKK